MAELGRIEVPAKFPNDESATVVNAYFTSGDHVNEGAALLDIEFSKATVELEAPCDGYAVLLCDIGAEVAVGSPVAIIYSSVEETLNACASVSSSSNQVPPQTRHQLGRKFPPHPHGGGNVETSFGETETFAPIFSRAALKRINETGGNPSDYSGRSFVRFADVGGGVTEKSVAPMEDTDDLPIVSFSAEKLSPLKGAEAANLLAGQNIITSNFQKSIAFSELKNRDATGTAFSSMQIVPTVLRECYSLLKKYRLLNAYFGNGAINVYDSVSIGYAIDLGSGLRILSLGDIEQLSDKEIKAKIASGVKAYMMNRLDPNDARRSTFIVTDLSNEGVDYFIPLLGKHQSATLGICSPDPATSSFRVSITFDHRVTEGRMVATFLRQLSAQIANSLSQ